jgi:hypothetical protein
MNYSPSTSINNVCTALMLDLCNAEPHGSSSDFSTLHKLIACKTKVVNITATVQITDVKVSFFTYRVSIDIKQSEYKQLIALR